VIASCHPEAPRKTNVSLSGQPLRPGFGGAQTSELSAAAQSSLSLVREVPGVLQFRRRISLESCMGPALRIQSELDEPKLLVIEARRGRLSPQVFLSCRAALADEESLEIGFRPSPPPRRPASHS